MGLASDTPLRGAWASAARSPSGPPQALFSIRTLMPTIMSRWGAIAAPTQSAPSVSPPAAAAPAKPGHRRLAVLSKRPQENPCGTRQAGGLGREDLCGDHGLRVERDVAKVAALMPEQPKWIDNGNPASRAHHGASQRGRVDLDGDAARQSCRAKPLLDELAERKGPAERDQRVGRKVSRGDGFTRRQRTVRVHD